MSNLFQQDSTCVNSILEPFLCRPSQLGAAVGRRNQRPNNTPVLGAGRGELGFRRSTGRDLDGLCALARPRGEWMSSSRLL